MVATSRSDPHGQSHDQRIWQSFLLKLSLRFLDIVGDSSKCHRHLVRIEDGATGTRITVSGLSDGAGIDHDAIGADVDDISVPGLSRLNIVVCRFFGDIELNMGMPQE